VLDELVVDSALGEEVRHQADGTLCSHLEHLLWFTGPYAAAALGARGRPTI
jgi:hypothetical protein